MPTREPGAPSRPATADPRPAVPDAALRVEVRVAGDAEDRARLDVSLTVPPGVTVLMGPSGAGKTTLLLATAGLLRPSAGKIVLRDRVLYDATTRVFVPAHGRRVALVFQTLALFPHLTALENVSYGLPPLSRVERRERAAAWLERMRVGHLAGRRVPTLSGGEAQRVALARALASEPEALLLDEPFSALDLGLRAHLGAEVAALVDSLGLPTVLVTHDDRDAASLGARILELDGGRLRT